MRTKLGSFIFVLILLVGIVVWLNQSHKDDVVKWLTTHGEVAKDIDYRTWSIGPFWYRKNCMVYRVETEKHSIYWFRYGFFSDAVYGELPDGTYVEME